jgi:hypothetical protein
VPKFIPQRKNANKHTLHGTRLLEKSITTDGFIDAQTAAADGEMISGTARLELSAEKFADVEPIIVESDGTRPVIVVRTDIPNLNDPRAKRLSIAANQIAHTDWNPDGDLLKEWGAEDEQIKAMFAADEWRNIETETLNEDEAFSKLPQDDRAPFQQMTFTLHDTQAEQVREALKLSKAKGAFVDSENENSNGNALARICETYITEHGNS